MSQLYPLRIDAYSHIAPPNYKEALYKIDPIACTQKVSYVPALYDLDQRFRIMDRYQGVVQVLTLAWPPVEEIADSEKAVDLSTREMMRWLNWFFVTRIDLLRP